MIRPPANDNLPPIRGWLRLAPEAPLVEVAALLSYLDGDTWWSLVRIIDGPTAGMLLRCSSASVLC